MLIGSINNLSSECHIHPVLREALNYLERTDFSVMEAGKHQIDADNLYAVVKETMTKPKAEQPAEKHQQYIDLHFLLKGTEKIGWGIANELSVPVSKYDQENDFELYDNVADESFLNLTPGMYVVFFPDDIHRPEMCDLYPSEVRKVVLKICKSLFE